MSSNTQILIKRSLSTDKPSTLLQGELAYSYQANSLFIGSPSGTGSIEIGGFRDYSGNFTNGVGQYGSTTSIPVITVAANGQITAVDTAAISTTLDFDGDSGGPSTIDLISETLTIAGGAGLTSNVSGQTITLNVDDTVIRSNTPLPYQSIDGSLTISGNLNVLGTQTVTNTETFNVADPLIYLAANNYADDLVDIGFVGNYFDGATQRHAGVMRHAGNKQFYIFDNYDQEPTSNVINIGDSSFRLATLNANLASESVDVNNTLTLGASSQLYANGGAYFASAPYLYGGATLEDSLVLNSGNYVQLKNSDNSATLDIYNSGGTGANRLYVNSANTEFNGSVKSTGDLEVQGNTYTSKITATGDATLQGDIYAPNIPNAITMNLVYFDASTGQLSYGVDNSLTPTSIANGSYSLSIQSTDGLLVHNGDGIQLKNGAVIKDTTGNAVAFGENAGTLNQGTEAVAIGDSAGYNSQGAYGVAIGYGAGNVSQGQTAIAIGLNAGITNQGHYGIAIGNSSGNSQGQYSVAIGYDTGGQQGQDSIAIGTQAGKGNTSSIGVNTIAIGNKAGYESAVAGSIIFNASGSALNSVAAGLYINPVRYTAAQDATDDGIVFYNKSTKEVRYSFALDGGSF